MNWPALLVAVGTGWAVLYISRIALRGRIHDKCASCNRHGKYVTTRHTGQIVWRCKRCRDLIEKTGAEL